MGASRSSEVHGADGVPSAAELTQNLVLCLLGEQREEPLPVEAVDQVLGLSCPVFFRTGKLRLIHAASCPFRYSSMTSCGVR
jgi:hypothetical protein